MKDSRPIPHGLLVAFPSTAAHSQERVGYSTVHLTEFPRMPGAPQYRVREFLDKTLFWNAVELQRKLDVFQDYYNHNRFHASLGGDTPEQVSAESKIRQANLKSYR